jgi:hypothetical protein
MTEPLHEPPESLRALIDAERACPDPPPEVGQRIYGQLAAGLGLPPWPGDAGPMGPGPATAPRPAGAEALGKGLAHSGARGLVTFIVGAAVGAASYGTVQHLRGAPERPAPPAVVTPLPVPAAPLPPPPEPTPATAPPRAPVAPPSHASDSELGTARDQGLAGERKLIEMARTALTRGQTEGTLAALHRHARSFPNGQLAEERDSLFVQALVRKGDFVHARQRATRFHRLYPHSLFSPVVEQALRSIP